MDEEINKLRATLVATPDPSPKKGKYSFNLSRKLRRRYLLTREWEDLWESIRLADVAAASTSESRPSIRAARFHHLGMVLYDQYGNTGSEHDLRRSIEWHEASLSLTDGEDKLLAGRLETTGRSWSTLYQRTTDINDLRKAIPLFQMALDKTSPSHPTRSTRLDSLGVAYRDLFLRQQQVNDLETSIRLLKEAVDLERKDGKNYARRLDILGCVYGDRYQATRSLDDLEESTRLAFEAVRATPESDWHRAERVDHLGISVQDRYLQGRKSELDVLREALTHLVESLYQEKSQLLARLKAGSRAIDATIELEDWNQAAKHSAHLIGLLPKAVPRSNSTKDFQHALVQFSGLGSLAASVYLKAGKGPMEALQILERGRGIILSLGMSLRTDEPELKRVHPEVWSEYSTLRNAVASTLLATDKSLTSDTGPGGKRSISQLPDKVKELERIEQKVRGLHGFERFQLEPTENELISLAQRGPIISFNITYVGSHALLLTKHGVGILNLHGLTLKDIEEHGSFRILHAAGRPGTTVSVPVNGVGKAVEPVKHVKDIKQSMIWLWNCAVKPVLMELGVLWQDKPPETLPEIWWAGGSSLSLFPLHAAGYHDQGSTENCLSHVVSSYCPTIKAMQHSLAREVQANEFPVREGAATTLVVSMPRTAGHHDLKQAEKEAKVIQEHMGYSSMVEVLESPSPQAVLKQLGLCSVAHFACHGEVNKSVPSQSALLLGQNTTEKLTVDDIQSTDHDSARLAYLSACSTARADEKVLLDESIHLATAFQLAGFHHVVATLWSVDDHVAAHIASNFYEAYSRRNPGSACWSVARILHAAIVGYREEDVNQTRILDWAPFVHIGC